MDNFIIYNLEEENGDIEAIDDIIILQWLEYERNGGRIVICTDKSCAYIEGMFSAISKVKPIVIAERGTVILWNNFENKYIMPVDKGNRESLNELRRTLEIEVPNIWFHDNTIGFTVYYDEVQDIRRYLDKIELKNLDVVWKEKSVSIMPQNINYDKAIEWARINVVEMNYAGEIKNEA